MEDDADAAGFCQEQRTVQRCTAVRIRATCLANAKPCSAAAPVRQSVFRRPAAWRGGIHPRGAGACANAAGRRTRWPYVHRPGEPFVAGHGDADRKVLYPDESIETLA